MKNLLPLALVLVASNTLAAKVEFELIQSTPAETRLAHPKLRFAKKAWVELIRAAQKSIDLGQFYASAKKGEALDPIIEELEKAAKRGIKIRFLVSNELLKTYQKTYDRLSKIEGLKTRVYNIEELTGGILHTKYWIFDGKRAFIGSQNFDWRALTEIHEMGVLTSDSRIVEDLKKVFEYDWKLAGSGNPRLFLKKIRSEEEVSKDYQCRTELVSSPPSLNPKGLRSAEVALMEVIRTAKKQIKIQLLKYTPLERKSTHYWPVIDNELRAAAAKGVKVQILVSDWNQEAPGIYHIKSLAAIPNIQVKVATIPQSSRGKIPYARLIHSKYMTVDDDTLWLGTSNWSEDYFRNSRNVEAIFCKKEAVTTLNEVFSKIWKSRYARTVHRLRPKKRDRSGS